MPRVQVYRNITRSIAPGVHGHEDVKRAIALMLFGGVHKQTSEVPPPRRALLCIARPAAAGSYKMQKIA